MGEPPHWGHGVHAHDSIKRPRLFDWTPVRAIESANVSIAELHAESFSLFRPQARRTKLAARADRPLLRIFSDVHGPLPGRSRRGVRCFQ